MSRYKEKKVNNMESKDVVRADFDRIAALGESRWEHNSHYHKYLQKYLSLKMEAALDIGCGTGEFSRILAKRSKLVTAIDLSPEMIKKAETLSKEYQNIEYSVRDVMEHDFSKEKYDFIVSIATMHHLPMKEVLEKIKMALKPGGVVLILDLYKQKSITDILLMLAAIPTNLIYMLVKTGGLRKSREEVEAWEEHCKHDKYMTIEELRYICREVLPGFILKRHLFWRYSLLWRKCG